jgi:predicted solute-binding protein
MPSLPRVSAVSFLNTSPLVWGLLHGPQKGRMDLRFVVPSECADDLREGRADIGLVPIIELARQPDLAVIPGSAIACQGAVRTILLVSQRPIGAIRSFAADTSSRTSIVLAQIILRANGVQAPQVIPHRPDLDAMLQLADAALIIGDPAFEIDPEMDAWHGRPAFVYDLGALWVEMTGLPMVFAVWAAREHVDPSAAGVFEESKRYGLSHIDEIVQMESEARGFDPALVREYVTRHISYDLGPRERTAVDRYLRLAQEAGLAPQGAAARYLESSAIAGQEQNRC